MQVTRTDRAELAFSVLALAYVAFLVLDFYVCKLDRILLGVMWELLTIPLFLAVAAAFVFVVVCLLANRKSVNVCNAASALILFARNCFHLGQLRVLTGRGATGPGRRRTVRAPATDCPDASALACRRGLHHACAAAR